MRIFSRFLDSSTILKCAKVLSKRDQRKIVLVIFAQLFLSVLDLVGVAIVGVLGALAVRGVQSQQPGDRVTMVLKFLRINDLTFQNQIITLGIIATTILMARTISSIYINLRVLTFFGQRSADVSLKLANKLFSQQLSKIRERTNQATIFSLTTGVEIIMLKILGTAVNLVSDLSILVVMLVGLFVVEPSIAISALVFFGLIGLFLYLFLHSKAHTLGQSQEKIGIATSEKLNQILNSYREILVHERQGFFLRDFGLLRSGMSNVNARMAFMPNVSKYLMETAIVLGALLIAGIQFMLNDAVHAVASLSIFLAAGSRIAPAALRLQLGLVQIKESSGSAGETLKLIDELHIIQQPIYPNDQLALNYQDFNPCVALNNITFTYPSATLKAIDDVSFEVKAGERIAIVGPSGGGKTTLVDLLLGIIDPDIGHVQISGMPPRDAIARWPGAISYVPQEIVIINASIAENIAFGFSSEEIPAAWFQKVLKQADLSALVESLPNGINSQVGENGFKLSGGQKQRIGIARALFTNPRIIVLDEATSSLDSGSELRISDAMRSLTEDISVVMIAHRLSTVVDADKVIYLEEGKCISIGAFSEVRNKVQNFEEQARLMGLN